MLLLKNRKELADFVESIKSKKLTLGFIPTMGALHNGHLSLIKKSIEENQYTVCSVFVNPTQFNNSEDLEKYPRTQEADAELLKNIGCDAVYFPKVSDLYPNGLENDFVELGGLTSVMEGKFRPGHFEGVVTVVKRLLMQAQPTKAYFGEKDFQQLQIIRKMVEQENLPVEIVGMPIIREDDGLAKSSRNTRLTPEFRALAPQIYQSLLKAKEWAKKDSPEEINRKIISFYQDSPLKIEYFYIGNENTLQKAENFISGEKYRAFIVVYAGEIRLIDNIELL